MKRPLILLILFTLFLPTFGIMAQAEDRSVEDERAKGWRGLVPLHATRRDRKREEHIEGR